VVAAAGLHDKHNRSQYEENAEKVSHSNEADFLPRFWMLESHRVAAG
jgi:hypothetical protein